MKKLVFFTVLAVLLGFSQPSYADEKVVGLVPSPEGDYQNLKTQALTVSGGSPQPGKVLTAIDNQGNARWTANQGIRLGTSDCYINEGGRYSNASCRAGYYVKSFVKGSDNRWESFATICCNSDSSVVGTPYNTIVANCRAGIPAQLSQMGEVYCPDPD